MNDLIADWMKPYLPIVGALVRGAVQLASGLGFAWAAGVSGDLTTLIVTAIAALLSLGWSVWQKVAAAQASMVLQHAAAVASAKQTAHATLAANHPVLVPVTVNVTPGDQPNEAVLVSRAEASAAPSVPAGVAPSPAPRSVA